MTKQELQKEYAARIKDWKESNPVIRPGRGATEVSPPDRSEASAIARRGSALGIPVARTAKGLGIGNSTLAVWMKRETPATKLVTSRLSTLTMPSGAKVEGLTVPQIAALLKALA